MLYRSIYKLIRGSLWKRWFKKIKIKVEQVISKQDLSRKPGNCYSFFQIPDRMRPPLFHSCSVSPGHFTLSSLCPVPMHSLCKRGSLAFYNGWQVWNNYLPVYLIVWGRRVNFGGFFGFPNFFKIIITQVFWLVLFGCKWKN